MCSISLFKNNVSFRFITLLYVLFLTFCYSQNFQVIRLSAATQEVPRSVICNVHGVNPKFIEIGKLKHRQISQGDHSFFKGAYYIGKMVWSKGYTELLQLLQKHQKELSGLKMELYGSGEDSDGVKAAAEKLSLDIRVYPGRDHADSIFHE
jgi:digalactosyldiacylglycerol synthase